ncbi:PTS transporter subunit EIIC [uncultured Microbacterium sp.]|uniref:PTS transporter subunit EIIC n=1 Tax=uncultured Microbacterium sp. TaxID=191216 RepID=UPI0033903F7F
MHVAVDEVGVVGLIGGGGSFIFPVAGASNLAQAGACFAVALLARRRSRLRAVAVGAGVPASFGIAEPAIFGVNLRLQFPFVATVVASAAAGALLSVWDVESVTLGAAGVIGVASITPGYGVRYLVCILSSGVLAFALTWVWAVMRRRGTFDDPVDPGVPPAAAGTLDG